MQKIKIHILTFVLLVTYLQGCNTNTSDGSSDPLTFSDVFIAGEEDARGENNEKFAQFREQNVVVTNSGKVVVIVQGRNASKWSDRSGQDLWCKISGDNGISWSEPVFIATHGKKSMCPNAAVYDKITNKIHVLYNLFMWDYTHVPEDVKGDRKSSCRERV